ncbi:hypothetical protein [Symmachiella macrocystis]|nr:hypothetical protein [Symmachiella macrocystis]
MFSLGIFLIVVGLVLSFANWWTLLASSRSGQFVSAIPLVPAIALGAGMVIIPQTRSFAWVAVLLDYGTLILIISLPRMCFESWCTSRHNLMITFYSSEQGRQTEIRLYRRQIAVVSVTYNPPVQCNEHGALQVSGGMVAQWEIVGNSYSLVKYDGDRELIIARHGDDYETIELHYPEGIKYDHDRLGDLTLKEIG